MAQASGRGTSIRQTDVNPDERKPRKLPSWLDRIRTILLASVIIAIGFVLMTYLSAEWAARGRSISDPAQLADKSVGLVFGTTDRVAGRENLYFRYRIDAAERLWKSGKLRAIIVSGDNRSDYYNEPNKMRSALIQRGVPASKIVRDFAGRRTLDSVYRAKEVFGADRVVFISQRFQNERAIYLAKAQCMKAWAWNAEEVRGSRAWKTRIREVGARIKMWLDVQLLNTQPKHYGPKESLPE